MSAARSRRGCPQIGKSLVAAFGIRRKFFHFEFFVQGGDYIPIEINSRPPGGAILDMMNYSVDGDLYRAWAGMVAGRAAEVPTAKKYVIGYVGRKDKSYTFSHAEILARFGHLPGGVRREPARLLRHHGPVSIHLPFRKRSRDPRHRRRGAADRAGVMNRNIVILSPHFPPHYHRFWLSVKQAGANALGIGDEPYEALSEELRSALTEYYVVSDMHDYDALIRACGYFTHRYGKIDRFDSLNEYWLGTEARIRDDFNIAGVRSADIDFIRRKSMMKELFHAAGVRVARGRVVHSPAEARALIRETGYPVIAKPDAGVGALNTFRIDAEADLDPFFTSKPAVDYLMEEFIAGTIHSFDGLADADGNPLFCTSHVFSQGIMETVNEARHIYYYSMREIPAELERIGRRLPEELRCQGTVFPHRVLPHGLRRIRGAGGQHAAARRLHHRHVQLWRRHRRLPHLGAAAGARRRRPRLHPQISLLLRQPQIQPALPVQPREILARFGHLMLQVQSVPGVFSSALGDVGYIFRSDTLDEIMDVVRFIHEPAT